VLTDGRQFTSSEGVQETVKKYLNFKEKLTLPNLASNMSSQLTKEPFRWDQRVFSVSLKFPSIPHSEKVKNEPTLLDPLCEVTGGGSYVVTNLKSLMQCMEDLCFTKMKTGVIVNFEPILFTTKGPTNIPTQSIRAYHKMIHVKQNQGFWPIPESFLPTTTMTMLPQRSAQPIIHILPSEKEIFVFDKFPFDSYEIENCNLTNFVLEHQTTFLTFIPNSKGSAYGDPFGFIKAKDKQTVLLYVFPYNFQKLFALLDELIAIHKMIPTPNWRAEFERYLYSSPPYYIQPLKNGKFQILLTNQALKRINLPISIIPEHLDGALNYSINSYLKKLKKKTKLENDMMTPKEIVPPKSNQKTMIKNPFDIERDQLMDQLDIMQSTIFHIKRKFDSSIDKLSVPISQMGNFHDASFQKQVLRNPLSFDEESTPISFGSPFRKEKKKLNVPIDESETLDESNFLKKGIKEVQSPILPPVENSIEKVENKSESNFNLLPENVQKEILDRIAYQNFMKENQEIKRNLWKELKSPKTNDQEFVKHLEKLKGEVGQKRKFLDSLIGDVKSFKKKKLEMEIEKFASELK
jgi:hypothetical protein